MCLNNTSHLIYIIKRSNNRKLFIGNTKFTLGRTKIANFNSAKTFKIANSQTLISANISSFTVCIVLFIEPNSLTISVIIYQISCLCIVI